jgi:arylsulfatase A-like enzyme
MRNLAPERLGGQGVDHDQEESANRAILHLLSDPVAREQVDLVLTWRADEGGGAYEVWSGRGLVRFRRTIGDDGTVRFEVVEVIGANPVGDQDPLALATLEDERAAAVAGGFDPDDPARRFIAPAQQSYPYAYERIAQLFDSPNAPDLAVSPKDWCSGVQPGTHGALHVRQARAPLWFSGPGVRPGHHPIALRSVDIAPTCLAALGFPFVDGADATGRRASERGVEPDVYLARQDGVAVEELLDRAGPRPKRLYVFLLDGLHQTEVQDRLAADPTALPNLRRLHERGAIVAGGSIVNFPSITWPSHTAILTGAWCGHHDVVNPSYYLRERRETVSPQGQALRTEGYASTDVESLYEAFHRQHPGCVTAAINAPFGRSARHADLEGRLLCDKARLKERTAELAADQNPRWVEHADVRGESVIDTRGLAQVLELFTQEDHPPPLFVYHELALTDGAGHEYGPHSDGLRDALDESDRRIGRVLDVLDERGLFEETLFVVTADHGMAPQDVALRANPAALVDRAGVVAVVAEPMIWLLDVAVTAERAADRRTGRVLVSDDADADGERPPVGGAAVIVEVEEDGTTSRLIAGTTNESGAFGFATPSHLDDDAFTVTISATGKSTRRLRLDGTNVAIDLRAALYGSQAWPPTGRGQ